MNYKTLVNMVSDIAHNKKTVYMWGVFGAPVTAELIAQKTKQYPNFYTVKKQAQLLGLVGKGYFGFDCVNLIKAVIWGWNGNYSERYGGAKYTSNSFPDINANQLNDIGIDKSMDFTHIMPGEYVWMKGHIGVYIGAGRVVEATPMWKDGVQVTACLNIGPIAGLNGRKWTNHGKIPTVAYPVVDPLEDLVSRVTSKLLLDSPSLWLDIIKGERTPTPQQIKALFEKILKEV